MSLKTVNRGDPTAADRCGAIALTCQAMPHDIDLKNDYEKALRRLLHNALSAARSAERRIEKQQAEINRLRRLSITDEATGLLNRRGFSEALERTIARSRRFGEPAVLLLIDLDGFKIVNDTYGHSAGDAVLRSVAKNLKAWVRSIDDVARLGGDEFAVLLNKMPHHLAGEYAKRIEAQLSGIVVPWNGSDIAIGASVGRDCVGAGAGECARAVCENADRSMYVRKKRNRAHQAA